MNKLLIATTNLHKLKEIRAILADLNLEILSLADLKQAVPDVVENGETFKENALKKASEIATHTGMLTLADDSGLSVDILGGIPGVYSARFAGDSKDDAENRHKLLDMLADYSQRDQRTARFKCAMALCSPSKVVGIVEGECEGYIIDEEIGDNGFGYDSIFFYPDFGKTFAQASSEEKNKVSHRLRALELIKPVLKDFVNK